MHRPYNCSYMFLHARLEIDSISLVSIEISSSLFDEGIKYYLFRVSHATISSYMVYAPNPSILLRVHTAREARETYSSRRIVAVKSLSVVTQFMLSRTTAVLAHDKLLETV